MANGLSLPHSTQSDPQTHTFNQKLVMAMEMVQSPGSNSSHCLELGVLVGQAWGLAQWGSRGVLAGSDLGTVGCHSWLCGLWTWFFLYSPGDSGLPYNLLTNSSLASISQNWFLLLAT